MIVDGKFRAAFARMKDIQAKAGVAACISIAKRDGAGFPTAAIIAARESTQSVEKLVVRVGFPLCGLAASCDDDAGAIWRTVFAGRNSSGEVHDSGDGAEDTGAVVDETDELAHIRLPPEIEHTAQCGVMIAGGSDLCEEDAAFEMIYYSLPALGGPPFDSDVGLPTRRDDPIRHIGPDSLGDLRSPSPLQRMKVDVAPKQRRADGDAELAGEILREAMDAVPRAGIAFIQQRVIALDDLALAILNRSDKRIV